MTGEERARTLERARCHDYAFLFYSPTIDELVGRGPEGYCPHRPPEPAYQNSNVIIEIPGQSPVHCPSLAELCVVHFGHLGTETDRYRTLDTTNREDNTNKR